MCVLCVDLRSLAARSSSFSFRLRFTVGLNPNSKSVRHRACSSFWLPRRASTPGTRNFSWLNMIRYPGWPCRLLDDGFTNRTKWLMNIQFTCIKLAAPQARYIAISCDTLRIKRDWKYNKNCLWPPWPAWKCVPQRNQ